MNKKPYAYTIGSKGKSFYWGEISPADMSRALQIAKNQGYRAAVEFLGRMYPGLPEYVLDESRIRWLSQCYDSDHKDRCLDLGSGWGSISFPLTKFFDETFSLDRVSVRLEFQKIRAKEDRVGSISFVLSDGLSLPCKDTVFDLVVSNGILEWVGFSRDANPRSAQLTFLKEIKRSLKPGGCLYIGVENRFGINYWLGGKDHTSLPFTSLLPRKLADFVVRRRLRKQGWDRYYTYTYSHRGYRTLLNDAGFHFIRFYAVYPSYNFPEFMAPINDGNAYSTLANQIRHSKDSHSFKRFASAIAARVHPVILGRALPIVWPSFLIFAWNDYVPKRIEDVLDSQHGNGRVQP